MNTPLILKKLIFTLKRIKTMNETQQTTIREVSQLYDRLLNLKEVNHYDELRLIVIQERIKDINKMLDEFGKPLYERLK